MSSPSDNVFVIGDVHGHHDRLLALLAAAGFSVAQVHDRVLYEPKDGVEIIQLGDLGHFDLDSRERDLVCWQIALAMQMTVLWGNHDAAVFDPAHHFRGYCPPFGSTIEIMKEISPLFAVERHGYLITHAGLHPAYASANVEQNGAAERAAYINHPTDDRVLDDIGPRRRGGSPQGGVLWRDAHEPLCDDFPQIFGHSAGRMRRYEGRSYCIDVGSKSEGDIAGIWLPSCKIVTVGPNAMFNQKADDVPWWCDCTDDHECEGHRA